MVTYNSTANWGISQYIVSTTPGIGSYTTIQSAITAANTAGGGCVIVEGGNYTENLTIPANVVVCNAASLGFNQTGNGNVFVLGQHTYNPGATATSTFVGINFQSTAGSAMFVVQSSSGTGTLRFSGCSLFSVNNVAIQLLNGGSVITGTNTSVRGNTAAVTLSGNGTLSADDSNFFGVNTSAGTIQSIGTGNIGLTYTGVFSSSPSTGGAVVLASTGQLFSSYGTFQTGTSATSAIVIVGATSQFTSNFDTFNTSSSALSFYITGTGTFKYSVAAIQSPNAQTIDPGLTISSGVVETASVVKQNATTARQIEATGAANTFGVATLSSGTVAIATTAIQSTSRVRLVHQEPNASTGIGILTLGTVAAGSVFVVNSLNTSAAVETGDASTIYWEIIGSV